MLEILYDGEFDILIVLFSLFDNEGLIVVLGLGWYIVLYLLLIGSTLLQKDLGEVASWERI